MQRPAILVLSALVFFAATPCFADSFDDFLPGAKAMAMGSAYSAVADDPNAIFYNPAGTANTPYAQSATSVARLNSPIGTLSAGALTYVRPFEPINTATIGAAYLTERQDNGGDKDEFMFHYSQEVKVPSLLLSRPLKVGANFKFVDDTAAPGDSSLFGIGFDAGVLARSSFGLNGSMVLQDLNTNTGQPRPKLDLGTAYTWQKWLTGAADFRVRGDGLANFYPGVEAAFDQGLLKIRAGRGFQLNGVSQFSWGFGVNFSPVVLDVAMEIPTGGIHRQGGGYQMTFNYRFGAPSFSGTFVGNEASQAESLRSDIQKLEEKKKDLDAQAKESETHSQISEQNLDVLEKRVRETEDQYRELQKKNEETQFGIKESEIEDAAKKTLPSKPPLIRKPKPKKKIVWPIHHVVKPGETLRSMAKTFYGDGNLWELIYDANKDKVERGLPQEGVEFVIPAPPKP